jgi:hypothetical protein
MAGKFPETEGRKRELYGCHRREGVAYLCVRSTFNRGEELIIVVNHLVDHKPFQS